MYCTPVLTALNRRILSIVILFDSLKPADIIVRVSNYMNIECFFVIRYFVIYCINYRVISFILLG